MRKNEWENYGKHYRIASHDFLLAGTGKPFRFVVKQNIETKEIRCFGSTHCDQTPHKILDYYHIRWPVETGIKDLIQNYFLNCPTGTSSEKIELHYYCVMLARLTIDFFVSLLPEPKWQCPEEWSCVLSTIRSTIFCNQNCELSLDDSGDFKLTYLEADTFGIKMNLAKLLDKRREMGLNKVSWWGNKGLNIEVMDQFDF